MKSLFSRFLFCLFLFIGYQNIANAQVFKSNDWTKIYNKSIEARKMLILEFSTDWCMPCKRLEEEVFEKDTIKKALSTGYELAKVNAEKGVGILLAKKYAITAYPTILIFNTKGVLIGYKRGVEGIVTPNDFLQFLKFYRTGKHLLPAPEMSSDLKIKYPQFYDNYYLNHFVPDTAVIDDYLKTQTNWFSEKNWVVLSVFGQRKQYLKYIRKYADKYIKLYGCMVLPVIKRSIKHSISEDFEKSDSSSFQRDLQILLKLRNADPIIKVNNNRWKYFMKLSFWGKTGLNWHKFMGIWEEYRKGFDYTLDGRAIEIIAANCHIDSIFNYAINLQKSKINADSTNIRNYVLLAHLLLKDDTGISDLLYTKAVRMANGDQSIINRITSSRLQNSLLYGYSIFHEAMEFMKLYSPSVYLNNSNLLKAVYFDEHQEWKSFVKSVNNYIQQIGGPDSIKNTKLFAQFAHKINVNDVKDVYSIRSAYRWIEMVLEIEPDNATYKNLYYSLKNKLR